MIPARLLTQEAHLIRRSQTGPPDDFGTPTWVEEEIEAMVWVHPVDSDEIEDRPAGRFTHRGYAVGTTPKSVDALVLANGQEWEVDGPGRTFHNPRTQAEFVVFDLVGYGVTNQESGSS